MDVSKPDLSALPAVHRLLDEPRVARFVDLLGPVTVKQHIGRTLERTRARGSAPRGATVADEVVAALAREAGALLRGVLNGTGILLHTNLGRAPLAREALDAVAATASASNLEFDLASGTRGSRHDRLRGPLRALTGAEDALVVNNCAAAVLLMLDTFARAPGGGAREVIVARNELVEIGGGFRLPDVLARSGAALVEVGTANKVRLDDYARALTPRTALLLRTHRSNHRLDGFVEAVVPSELVALGRRAGVTVLEDLGSGALTDLRAYGLPYERTVQEAVADGFDLVAFSGDKLLGGPQAGIVVGRTAAVARLRANPLLRALRVGATTVAALGATLALHRDPASRARIPFFAMLAATNDELRARAHAVAARVPDMELSVLAHDAYAGGGTLPLVALPSVALAWQRPRGGASAAAARLRAGEQPVVTQVADDAVLIDLRTIAPQDDGALSRALEAAR